MTPWIALFAALFVFALALLLLALTPLGCAVFGHKPEWERRVYQDRHVQQARCERCLKRLVAIDDGPYDGTPAPTRPDENGLRWGV